MAAGSEKISKKWIVGAKRECVKCQAPIKNLERDVGVVRTTYPGRVREIVCMTCHLEKAKPRDH